MSHIVKLSGGTAFVESININGHIITSVQNVTGATDFPQNTLLSESAVSGYVDYKMGTVYTKGETNANFLSGNTLSIGTNQVAIGNGTNVLSGSSNLVFASNQLTIITNSENGISKGFAIKNSGATEIFSVKDNGYTQIGYYHASWGTGKLNVAASSTGGASKAIVVLDNGLDERFTIYDDGALLGNYTILNSATTALGNIAGVGATGLRLTALGNKAGRSCSGDDAIIIGDQSYSTLPITGNRIIVIGNSADGRDYGSDDNIYIGYEAMSWNQTGKKNLIIGNYAGYNSVNTSNCVLIGYNAGIDLTTQSDILRISNSGAQLIHGNFATKQVAINTTAPTANATLTLKTSLSDGTTKGLSILNSGDIENFAVYDNGNTIIGTNTASANTKLTVKSANNNGTSLITTWLNSDSTEVFKIYDNGDFSFYYINTNNFNQYRLFSADSVNQNFSLGINITSTGQRNNLFYSEDTQEVFSGNRNIIMGNGNGVGAGTFTGSHNIWLGNIGGFSDTRTLRIGMGKNTLATPLIYGDFDNTMLRINSYLQLSYASIPGTPDAANGVIYTSTDGKIYYKNDSGVTYDLTNSGATTDLSNYYNKNQVDANFLSATTSFYTQAQANANFLSASTAILGGVIGNNQVAFGNGSSITGTSNLIFSSNQLTIKTNSENAISKGLVIKNSGGTEILSIYDDGSINLATLPSTNRATYLKLLDVPILGIMNSGNYFFGYDAFKNAPSNGDVSSCIGIGLYAGYNLSNANNNIMIGYQAGYTLNTGSGNILIGFKSGSGLTNQNNLLRISNTTDNTNEKNLISGDFSSGQVGINTTSLSATLTLKGSGNDGLTNILNFYDDLNTPLLGFTDSGILTLNRLSGTTDRAVEINSTGLVSASKEFVDFIIDVTSGDTQNRNLVSDTWVGNTFERDGIEGQWGFAGNYEYRCVSSMGLWTRYPANKEYQDVFITDGDVISSLTDENNWDVNNSYIETSASTLAKIYNGQWFISAFYDYKYFVYDIDAKRILRDKINEKLYKQINGITGNTSLGILVPAGYRINSIILAETSGATGVDINIGTGSTGSDVSSDLVAAGSVADLAIAQSFFSVYFNQELFISSGDWGNSIVNVYLKTERVI